jgi:trehalose 6-phosphate synthase/phosphatase
MPLEEQQSRMKHLQKRLKRYNVEKWASEFLAALEATNDMQEVIVAKKMSAKDENELIRDFKSKNKRLLFLDYDGTLVGFKDNPQDAKPTAELYELLDRLNALPNTEVVLISGRDRETFEKWFSHKNYTLITDHGVWICKDQNWQALERLKTEWMKSIRPILDTFVDRTPGTFIEPKTYSLAWHYRTADPELAQTRTIELNTVLTSMVANNDLSVLEGNKVIEIKSSNVNKGRAVNRVLVRDNYDFVLVIGDDWTDEYMFEEAPDFAHTIKVGYNRTKAKYQIKDSKKVLELLTRISSVEK